MNIIQPKISRLQGQQELVHSANASNIQAKSPAPVEDVVKVQHGLVASLRDTAIQETRVRPEMLAKGAAFFSDPNYPPLDKLNGLGSIIVNDFFLRKLDSDLKQNTQNL